MLLALFAYSLIPTIILFTVTALIKIKIIVVYRGSCISQFLGIMLVLSTLFTATTGAILLAQSILT